MKKLFSFRYLTALCFLLFLALFFLLSLRPFARESYYALRAGVPLPHPAAVAAQEDALPDFPVVVFKLHAGQIRRQARIPCLQCRGDAV